MLAFCLYRRGEAPQSGALEGSPRCRHSAGGCSNGPRAGSPKRDAMKRQGWDSGAPWSRTAPHCGGWHHLSRVLCHETPSRPHCGLAGPCQGINTVLHADHLGQILSDPSGREVTCCLRSWRPPGNGWREPPLQRQALLWPRPLWSQHQPYPWGPRSWGGQGGW